MRLLHKIIRNQELCHGNAYSRYNLNLRHSFKDQTDCFPTKSANCIPPELADARHQAEAIIKSAQEEAESIKASAAQEGYAEGYRAALENARAEADKTRAEAREVLARAEEARRNRLAGLKENILDLALEIAEKIVARELELNPDAVMAVAEEAMQTVSSSKYVVLWVNPGEAAIYEANRERLLRHLPPRSELQIMPDPDVEQGGCMAETDFGKVDARLSTRWQNLYSTFKEGQVDF